MKKNSSDYVAFDVVIATFDLSNWHKLVFGMGAWGQGSMPARLNDFSRSGGEAWKFA
jgi:hypothetical protein